jgi:hypothetical protein
MNTQKPANESSSPDAAAQAAAAYQAILRRSATDRAFRKQLVSDPRAAVADFVGVPSSALPESLKVRFVESAGEAERTPGMTTVVLPAAAEGTAELSESELETVAGGTTGGMTTAVDVMIMIMMGTAPADVGTR